MPGFADDVTRLIPHLRRFARALVRGHAALAADDLVQETVVLAMRAERLARGPDLTNWCFATLMRVHRLRAAGTTEGFAAPRSEADGRPRGAVAFLPRDIARLDELALEEREVLLLATLVGMSYAQIAATLHVTTDIVMSRLDHARHRLAHTQRHDATYDAASPVTRMARAAGHLRLVK